jgi:ATP-dependent RNA helicase RhlE
MSFATLSLSDHLLKAIDRLGYSAPTPIQTQAIPLVLEGLDLMVEAKTGTGKTAAFALPLIQKLSERPAKSNPKNISVLVLVPTRELALQVTTVFDDLAKFSARNLRCLAVLGGQDIEAQVRALQRGVDVLISTPGRLLQLISMGELSLAELDVLVLDEADKLLDLSFSEELQLLLKEMPSQRQSLLFSATLPPKILALGKNILKSPLRVGLESVELTVDSIEQRVFEVPRDRRRALLTHLILTEVWTDAMVFVASKRAARNLADKLQRDGISVDAFHGDLSQQDRVEVLEDFMTGKFKILVTTDIGARGLDIQKLSMVVNYDLPRSAMNYVHRVGRTGRAGQAGKAISFIDFEDREHFRLIEKRARIKLTREQVLGFELLGEAPVKVKGSAPVKGKGKSKKDKLREQAAQQNEALES